ncbi:MAG TPA: hypothetical protein VF092_02825 [Longimicrobium sp.]
MRCSALISGILAAAVLAPGLPGQTIQIANLDVPRTLQVETGEDLLLDVNPAMLRQAGGAEAIRIRMVQGSYDEILRLPAGPDGCVVLETWMADPEELDGATLKSGIRFSNRSLQVRHGRPSDQAWYLIFERRNGAGPVIKINKRDLRNVLEHGVQVTVRAPRSLNRDQLRRLRERSAGVQNAASVGAGERTQATVRCMVLLAASPEVTQLAAADRCGSRRGRRTGPRPVPAAGETITGPRATAVWDLAGEALGG